MVGASRLGHFPQGSIATDLANRFGGFANDFLIARHRERDYVLFLPVWVHPDDILTQETIRLANCKLRCFAWNPYNGAPCSQLSYKAWIKIISLPYECWTEPKVAAIVNGFGRFLRSDDPSSNMFDLTGYRCQIAVDDLSDIPESLVITFGDISITTPVRLESSAPFGGDDRGIPFAGGDEHEGGDQHDPLGRRLARRVATLGVHNGENDSREGAASGEGDTWNSSEI